jgi:hypothetical protein
MRCHIMQAYFRTALGGRLESANTTILEYENRFALAGTFWHILRATSRFAPLLQAMNISGGLGKLLLGEESKLPIQVEAGHDYYEIRSSWFDKLELLHFFRHRQWLHGVWSGMSAE